MGFFVLGHFSPAHSCCHVPLDQHPFWEHTDLMGAVEVGL